MLVEPQQIPGSTAARPSRRINPYEQAQIIEQRMMTRANLSALGKRIGLYADQPDLSVGDGSSATCSDRIEFIGFEPRRRRRGPAPRARSSSASPSRHRRRRIRHQGRQRARLAGPRGERRACAPDRASDTLEFFQAEVDRLSAALDEQCEEDQPTSRPPTSPRCPTAWTTGATSSSASSSGCSTSSARNRHSRTSAPPWSGFTSAPGAR